MLEELQLRNYANFTIERYLDVVRKFAKFFDKSPDQLGPEQIREYLLHLVRDKESAPNTFQIQAGHRYGCPARERFNVMRI